MRRGQLSVVASGLLLGCLGPAQPAPPGQQAAAAPTGLDVVRAYNARNLGAPGWRRVSLELETEGQITRRFTVVNLWRNDAGVVRTLFVLEEPQGLRGTNYLLIEDLEQARMQVFLHLPAGRKRVLTIEPSAFDEGLLGSDFSYRDLRMQVPLRGYRFVSAGEAMLPTGRARMVSAEPLASEARRLTPWGRVLLYFDREAPVLVGADYFSAADPGRPRKSLRVLGWRQMDGAWTETVMLMRGPDGRSSRITLQDVRFSAGGVEPALFSPAALPALAARLRLGGSAAPVSAPRSVLRAGPRAP